MKSWPQGHCSSDDVSLRYFRSGGSNPPLVFVHGFTDSSVYFTRAAAALAAKWDVVAYDARGHGQSDRTEIFDDATRVADLVAVVQQLALNRPAMIGHSMGAATIAQAIARHSGLSRAVVLEDPSWSEPTDEEIALRREMRGRYLGEWRAWVADLQRKSHQQALAQRLSEEPTWSPVDVEMALEGRFDFQLNLFDQFPLVRSPWQPLVPRFDCPSLLLIGDDQARGAIITRDQAGLAATLHPLLQWAQVEGAGHHVKYDRFDQYLAQVTAFLDPFA